MTADPLAGLRALTAEYHERRIGFEFAAIQVKAAMIAALRDGWSIADVADASPYVRGYVRALARAEGIPPERPGRKVPR